MARADIESDFNNNCAERLSGRNKCRWWDAELNMPDPKLHSLLNFNPEIEEERRKFDGQAVVEEVQRNPHAARARYTFKGCYESCYPLHMAIMLGASTSVVEVILNAFPGAIECKDRYKSTPLHSACEFQASLEVALLLLEKFPGAAMEKDCNMSTPLNSACKCQPTPEMVMLMVKSYPDAIRQKNNEGMTPLHSACAYQASFEVVSLLLKMWPGAAREKDNNGMTPLHNSCEYEASLEVISLLVEEYPAAVKETGGYGGTPLHSACWNGAPEEVLKLLLEKHPSAVRERDSFMGTLQNYDFDNKQAAMLVSNVSLLFCDKTDNETVERILTYFINIGWWGGAAIVIDLHPTILNVMDIDDKFIPMIFTRVKSRCRLLTVWQLIINRQDILAASS